MERVKFKDASKHPFTQEAFHSQELFNDIIGLNSMIWDPKHKLRIPLFACMWQTLFEPHNNI